MSDCLLHFRIAAKKSDTETKKKKMTMVAGTAAVVLLHIDLGADTVGVEVVEERQIDLALGAGTAAGEVLAVVLVPGRIDPALEVGTAGGIVLVPDHIGLALAGEEVAVVQVPDHIDLEAEVCKLMVVAGGLSGCLVRRLAHSPLN